VIRCTSRSDSRTIVDVAVGLFRGGVLAAGMAGTIVLAAPSAPPPPAATPSLASVTLAPTHHPPVAREASSLWLAPSVGDRAAALANPATRSLQDGSKLYAQQRYEDAIVRFSAAAAPKSPLRDYGSYYAGVSELRLQRFDRARRRFADLKDASGYLRQAAALGEAEADRGLKDYDAEVAVFERLLQTKPVDEPAVWLGLAIASEAGGERARAAEAYQHLYYDFPTSDLAAQAEGPLSSMPEAQPISTGNNRYQLELRRGERLFGLRRIGDARPSFLRVQPFAKDDDRELIALRLAECDSIQGKHLQAREALKPYLASGTHQAEARYFYLLSQRGLKNYDSFELLVRALMKDFPDSTWAEDALNSLVTWYLQDKSDEEIEAIVREQFERYPKGRYSERAAWKAGWFAYRAGNMDEAVDYFERGAATFPRSDYRPAYLYWAGRAREQAGDRAGAVARWQLETTDYLNTYYGPLAVTALKRLGVEPAPYSLIFVQNLVSNGVAGDRFPPNAETIRSLLALELYDPALKELEFARGMWGDSPVIQATTAWINRQKSFSEKGTTQFNLARGAINLMKRAYPQFLASGGEQLPREMLTIIYPLSYWELIKKYSAEHDLDPFLFAALTSQESTFVPDITSSANAYGLTQLLPVTARQYARKLGLRYSRSLLVDPDANVKMGSAYFADTVRSFGAVHFALASYNAGPTAVRRWMAQRPGLPQEVFIDDIPYPETQNYVKRILGTADDYRRLYGPG
jgi:soluble lytic murein transglycosylase